ncbi:MAG: hypothetical protein GX772_10245 [Alcaligenaceae bacterium]|nr:hypothetical protein [Alcaligenaceae bacterium]
MLAFALAASLITVPAPPGRSEAECIREHPGNWHKITDCVHPPLDLDKNPDFKRAVQACDAIRKAAQDNDAQLNTATLTFKGETVTCT